MRLLLKILFLEIIKGRCYLEVLGIDMGTVRKLIKINGSSKMTGFVWLRSETIFGLS
jgi:hypothetical protein